MFMYVWEYKVKEDLLLEFEDKHGLDGNWVRLFQQADGYLGTELHKDIKSKTRYVTIDYWLSKPMHDACKTEFAERFSKLDESCEALTEQESFLGEFTCMGSVRVI